MIKIKFYYIIILLLILMTICSCNNKNNNGQTQAISNIEENINIISYEGAWFPFSDTDGSFVSDDSPNTYIVDLKKFGPKAVITADSELCGTVWFGKYEGIGYGFGLIYKKTTNGYSLVARTKKVLLPNVELINEKMIFSERISLKYTERNEVLSVYLKQDNYN